MAIQYIDKKTGASDTTAIANDASGRQKIRNVGGVEGSAGISYDAVDHAIKFNGNDAIRTVAAGDVAQDFSGEAVAATNVVTAGESGKTFFLNAAAGFVTTLPAPALGLVYKFIVKTAPTGASYVINTPTANIIYGMFLERAGGAGLAGAAQDTVNFVLNVSIIGDWAEFYSDGTNWYVRGMTDVIAGVTFAVS